MISLPGEISGTRCSRAGCRAEATWAVNWRNPRIHGPERVKVWLACDDHLDHLTQFLEVRACLKDTVPVAQLVAADGT